MEKIYNPNLIEPIVQKYWDKKKTFQVDENTKKKKYYCLSMLPYPSGKLHMGHIRNYTISDIIARYQRMIGKNVLHPIGWDAFGLPAEEAAIKNNTTPKKWTQENIIYMRNQLKKIGFSYDWEREINTCDPKYYKWEQWFFNKLYIHNLVYKKKALIHWCPTDKTVLANEQIINGQCWRCQSNIITKFIPQWFIRIKKYAKRLLEDLKILKHWPKKVINMQKNWIGKSTGFEILFTILNSNKKIKIYTTDLIMLMQLKYISISPIHDLAKNEITKKQLKKYIQYIYTNQQKYKNYNELKYLGHKTSKYAIHPITKKKIPIWITNYTQIEYNTNIKMSVPEYNNYDRCFAKKYNIKINNNIKKIKNNIIYTENNKNRYFEIKKIKEQNYAIKNTISEKIFQILKKKNIIKKKIKYKIQDWGISRQRYWGAPIAMVKNKKKKIIPILENKLPIQLPNINSIDEFNDIKKIYAKWSKVKINQKTFIRETDTFDTFMESSWYYIKYTDPKYNSGMVNKKSANYWLPIDQYIGGIEHATMHLIYFRFLNKLLYDFNFIKSQEPAIKLLCQGMVLANAFYYIHKKKKIWISQNDLKITKDKNGNIKTITANNKKKIICAGMMKMSKSKNNGIDPQNIIHKYGADTIRLFIIFAAPINSDIQWNESGIKGMYRFLNKLWKLVYKYIYNTSYTIQNINKHDTNDIKYNLHTTILKVSHDIEKRQSFNTAISQIIKFTNYIFDIYITKKIKKSLIKKILNTIIKLLYPFAPHISFILWNKINNKKNIDYESWPQYNQKYTIQKKINFIIQINGKKKKILCINNNSNQIEILSILKQDDVFSKILHKKKKIIYIPNKLINLII